jgi:hypothetical protein
LNQVKVEPQKTTVPLGNLNTQHLSIKQIQQKSSETQTESDTNFNNRVHENFSLDQLKMAWKQLAFKMKEKGLENLFFALNKRDPKIINDTDVYHECDNQVQIDIIQTNLSEITEFIREALKNYSIQLHFQVIESQEENTKLLSGKDKFLALSKKNANLFSLQKTFNLDIDL